MPQWHALYYPLKPGSEEKIKDLFRASGRPSFEVTDADGATVGRLLSTLVFVGAEKAFRVIEVDGPLPLVAAHMSRQDEVRALEREMEPHLAVPRDMTTPDGARAFFQQAIMPCVRAIGIDAASPDSSWMAVFYPLKPDSEDAVAELFSTPGRPPDLAVKDDSGAAVAQLLGTMAFVGNGRALRVNQAKGDITAVGAHMSRQPSAREFQLAMDQYLAVPRDMTDPAAAGAFFRDAVLECVLARRHDQPA